MNSLSEEEFLHFNPEPEHTFKACLRELRGTFEPREQEAPRPDMEQGDEAHRLVRDYVTLDARHIRNPIQQPEIKANFDFPPQMIHLVVQNSFGRLPT